MNGSEHDVAIRRILVALDASTHSLAALNAAARLAAGLEAELIGLFVEDENLLHLAGLPFAREVRSPLASPQPVDSDKMERQLRLQASQARRALQKAAETVGARYSFRIVRGQVTASVLKAALEADLLAMGRVSRPISGRSRLGSTARAASAGTERPLLLMNQGSDLTYPVLVTHDGSRSAWQTLATAARLARYSGDDLNILLIAETRDEALALEQEIKVWMQDRVLSANFHWLPQTTVEALAEVIRSADDCVLILGGDNPLLRAEAIQELLDATDCPVLLFR